MFLSTRQNSSIITSVDELSEILGDSFVLFLGSAVSGKMEPCLPMVHQIRNEVLKLLSSPSGNDNYHDKLVKKYAKSLVSGIHKNLGEETKFEEFLWFLEYLADRKKLDDLLYRLFVCSSEECGPNQAAVATLLNSHRCIACFTTNFDNTIELKCPTIRPYIYPKYPTELPKRGESPILVKLHGDAKSKSCVAFSPQLYQDARARAHANLPRLLNGYKVLVLGYSGLGDIDIAPYLMKTKATFVWTGRDLEKLQRDVPWASYYAKCDLSSNNEVDKIAEHRNLLIDLALMLTEEDSHTGKFTPGVRHPWEKGLLEWCKTSEVNLELLLEKFFQWRNALPILHMQYTKNNEPNRTPKQLREYGSLCNQIRVYNSARAIFSYGLTFKNLDAEDQIDLRQGFGFSLWRLGQLDRARSVLSEALNIYSTSDLKLKSDVCRLYLEVSRDILRFTPDQAMRKSLYQEWNLERTLKILEPLPKSSPQNALLSELVKYDIMELIGSTVSFETIKLLYDECVNSRYQAAASACAEVLIRMSFWKGLACLRDSTKTLRNIGMWHYVYKNVIAGLNAIISKRFPWLLRFSYQIHRIWRGIYTSYLEWRFETRLHQWKSDVSRSRFNLRFRVLWTMFP